MKTETQLLEQNLVLIGFMGAGKSTVAAHLQQEYGMDVVEMDQLIETRQGMKISDIFATYGEGYFRDLESKLIEELKSCRKTVISCGGGAVLRSENVKNLKQIGRIVMLCVNPETVLERVKGNDDRPILKGQKDVASIQALMDARMEKYEAAADLMISTDGRSVSEICDEIMKG